MALKLKRGKKDKRAPEIDDAQASRVIEPPPEPGKPEIPTASYNVMTVRYAVQQRRNLVAIVLMGLVAIALLLSVGNWLKIRTDQASALDSIESTQQEILSLSTQLTDLSDTEGLAPEEVATRLQERQVVFMTAVATELDYGKLTADIRELDTNRAWVTGFAFSPGAAPGAPATMQVSGQAIDPLDVSDWYDVFEIQVPYATLLDEWPQFSGTPGESTAAVTWTANIQLDEDFIADRAGQYGVEIPEGLLQQEEPANPDADPTAAPEESP